MFNKFVFALAAAGLATSAGAAVNILVNPSFETGVSPDSVKAAGSTDISGWTVSNAGGVFYAETSWNASEGNRSVDLNGTGQGIIFQDVFLQIGKQYVLTFDYSAVPDGGRAVVPFVVGGRINQGFTYVVPVGHSASNMQYAQAEIKFTATSVLNRISFVSGTTNGASAVIDNAFLSLVPEPATWGMLIAGFGMVGFSMRRRRTALDSVSN